jgi:hypothetical protein
MAARGLALLLLLGAAALHAQQQQPPTEKPKEDPRLSQRQAERITQQERLIACNKRAREAGLRNAQRQQFTRECLKGGNAAVGGGAEPK